MDLLAHLRAARDLVDRAYAERVDLDRLARRAGYSRYHFLRAFAATYGQTPGRYLTHTRIERAKDRSSSSHPLSVPTASRPERAAAS